LLIVLLYLSNTAPAQKDDASVSCTPTECNIPVDNQTSSNDRLGFRLPDIYGRIVDSQDYANVPVLIMSGSCWCGGCQQDAEPLREIAAEYADKGLAVIRSVAGDNELAAMDFQKHYRLPFIQMLDTNRSFEKQYNKGGWTFLMLADYKGKIVYKINNPHENDWLELKNILNKILSSSAASKKITRDGIEYMPETLKRTAETEKSRIRERFPSIACDPDSRVYVVFTSNRNGSQDIFMRFFDGQKWSDDIPVAVTAADEYDSTVLADRKGHIYVCWTSNANGRTYDVFLNSFTNPFQQGMPIKVTNSDDDAMHARMACDEKNTVWITYYKWHKMGKYSRDKEVYLRKLENGQLSGELQISPKDVPQYEDHTEPAISASNDGVVVAWSWDFHPASKAYSNQAGGPTIFIRQINNDMTLGKISSVSCKNIDVTPSVAVSDNGQIWCSWDSLGAKQRKRVCVSNANPGSNNAPNEIQALSKPVANVCTPTLVAGSKNRLTLLWSESDDNTNWLLKSAQLDTQNKIWTDIKVIEPSGNPRFCSAAYDSQNQLWLAYSIETENGRKIAVKKLEEQLTESAVLNNNETTLYSNKNKEAAQNLRKLIDEKYSYRDLRGVDWDKLFEMYTPQLERAKTPQEFAELASKMLLSAKDMHLWVRINDKTINGFKRNINRNYNLNLLKKEVPRWNDLSRYVSTGQFPDGIGYILIESWAKDANQVLQPALQAIKNLLNSKSLIIDVRPNGGGSEPFAEKFAGCFVKQPVIYAKHIYRNVKEPNGWGQIQERILKPNMDMPAYTSKIAVLMGQANLSSCEAFLLMMKQVPECKLIGEKSYGSSGNPKPYDLGNGVTVWLPSWRCLRLDGTCFEEQGIEPDISVIATKSQLREKDPVLEAALKYLRNSF
jgi:peroxiredoxin